MGFSFIAGQTHTVPCAAQNAFIYGWQSLKQCSIATKKKKKSCSLKEDNVPKPKLVVLALLASLYSLELIDKFFTNR